MRNYIIIVCYSLLLLLMSCNGNRSRKYPDGQGVEFRVEMENLTPLNGTLSNVLYELDSIYNYGFQTDKEYRLLYVTIKRDSVFFDFTRFPKDCMQLFLEKIKDIKTQGYFENEDNGLLLIFDSVGIFKSEGNELKVFNFGYQEKEDPILFNPPLYRYYMKSNGQLIFKLESWFGTYQ